MWKPRKHGAWKHVERVRSTSQSRFSSDSVDAYTPGNVKQNGNQQRHQPGSQAEFMTLKRSKEGASSVPARQVEWVYLILW